MPVYLHNPNRERGESEQGESLRAPANWTNPLAGYAADADGRPATCHLNPPSAAHPPPPQDASRSLPGAPALAHPGVTAPAPNCVTSQAVSQTSLRTAP